MATDIRPPEEKNIPNVNHAHHEHGTREFWKKHTRAIVYGLIALVVLAAGLLIYKYYLLAPEEHKASEAMWKAGRVLPQRFCTACAQWRWRITRIFESNL